jgi:hypothetical protein
MIYETIDGLSHDVRNQKSDDRTRRRVGEGRRVGEDRWVGESEETRLPSPTHPYPTTHGYTYPPFVGFLCMYLSHHVYNLGFFSSS